MKLKTKLWLITFLTLFLGVMALPREDIVFEALPTVDTNITSLKVRQGLDLQGGIYLVYKADFENAEEGINKEEALNGIVDVINQRVNPGGTSEAIVQVANEDRIIVQIPGLEDEDSAIARIGQTAELSFFESTTGTTTNEAGEEVPSQNLIPTDINGTDLQSSRVEVGGGRNTGSTSTTPTISFQMKSNAIAKFRALTTRINQNNSTLLITLDDQILFNGSVSSPILTGQGSMTGFRNIEEASQISLLLNAGSLPVPIELEQQQSIGASLGNEAITKSLFAGIFGLSVLCIYMITYYRWAGVVASTALVIYTLLNLAIFKLSGLTSFTIVMTLAGIAGFILSIGMAVDANILIFERMKEEFRLGKNLKASLREGFNRAWPSIRDSNIATLITCFILYNFGTTTIKGFAVTLAIGVLTSMFTAITISRSLMEFLITRKFAATASAYGIITDDPKEDK